MNEFATATEQFYNSFETFMNEKKVPTLASVKDGRSSSNVKHNTGVTNSYLTKTSFFWLNLNLKIYD